MYTRVLQFTTLILAKVNALYGQFSTSRDVVGFHTKFYVMYYINR